ncbi:MAG: peptide ABC transporter substrate-binding protein, partial [Anaerolineales bacterium]
MDATSAAYIVEIFSGLVTLNPELEVVPDIAERWEVTEDGTVYTFYLRDDAKFHDGKAVTARDFKYS